MRNQAEDVDDSNMANVHHRATRIAAQQAHQRETQRTEEAPGSPKTPGRKVGLLWIDQEIVKPQTTSVGQ